MDTVPLKGYILQDGVGILGLVPDSQGSEQMAILAWKYIKTNKVLKTLYAKPGEDLIDFVIRVHKEAADLRKAISPN